MELILDLFSRYSQKLATAATVVLVVLITLSLANTAIFILDQYNERTGDYTSPTAGKDVAGSNKNAVRISDIASLNLFGVVGKTEISAARDAPETKLSLELQGVFTADDEAHSSAIVAATNKDGELFHIGDKLPGNATLAAVFDDHILMQRGTRFETLSFSDEAFRSPAATNSSRFNKRATRAPRYRDRPTGRTTPGDARRSGSRNNGQSSRDSSNFNNASIGDFVSANREQLTANPASVLSELGIESVAPGEAQGYTLAGEVPDAILKKSGLRRGDVILSVNGQAVGNAMQDTSLVASAVAQGRVRVEVQRADKRFFVTVPIQ